MPTRLLTADLSVLPWPPILSRSWPLALLLGLTLGLGWSPTAASATGVYLNLPLAAPERPANLPDDDLTVPAPGNPSKYLDVQTFVEHIAWASWGGSTATGTATVKIESSDTRPGHREPYASQSAPVTITASGLSPCGGQLVYTSYHLTLLEGASEPRDFHYARERALPCRLLTLGYYAGYEQVAHTTGDCLFRGVSETLPKGLGYMGYCKMRWRDWAKSRTVGTGIGRAITTPSGCDGHHSECDYGIRVTLTRPEWCPADGMSYTRERLEVFGPGRLSSTSLISRNEERQLRATIGHGARRLYFDQARPSQHCRSVTVNAVTHLAT